MLRIQTKNNLVKQEIHFSLTNFCLIVNPCVRCAVPTCIRSFFFVALSISFCSSFFSISWLWQMLSCILMHASLYSPNGCSYYLLLPLAPRSSRELHSASFFFDCVWFKFNADIQTCQSMHILSLRCNYFIFPSIKLVLEDQNSGISWAVLIFHTSVICFPYYVTSLQLLTCTFVCVCVFGCQV